MKIAYLILAHQNPRLLRKAIATLSCEEAGCFIHIDSKADVQQFSCISGSNIFFSKRRIPVYWGEFSMVRAIQLLIHHALERAENYGYFVLLSGSDYPLRSGGYIRDFLEANCGSEFMNLVQIPAPGYPLSKINKLRYPSHMPLRRFASRALARIGLAQRDCRKHLGALKPFAGSQWWALSRDACDYVLEFASRNPHVENYFRNTFTSDEMFFHTILGNSPFRSRMRRNLTFLDWRNGGNHPRMLSSEHVVFFEAHEKVWLNDEWGSGEALFARKFSDDQLDLVDRIDEMIKTKEASPSWGSSFPGRTL
jgi:hypothetical protein